MWTLRHLFVVIGSWQLCWTGCMDQKMGMLHREKVWGITQPQGKPSNQNILKSIHSSIRFPSLPSAQETLVSGKGENNPTIHSEDDDAEPKVLQRSLCYDNVKINRKSNEITMTAFCLKKRKKEKKGKKVLQTLLEWKLGAGVYNVPGPASWDLHHGKGYCWHLGTSTEQFMTFCSSFTSWIYKEIELDT